MYSSGILYDHVSTLVCHSRSLVCRSRSLVAHSRSCYHILHVRAVVGRGIFVGSSVAGAVVSLEQ